MKKGYKNTAIGVIPEDWEVVAIADVANVVSGGTPSTSNSQFWNGNHLWCTPTDITSNNSKYINNTKRKITDLGLNSSSATMLPIGSVLFCSRATIGVMCIANKEISTNQGFKSMIVKPNYDNEFLYYRLHLDINKFIEKSIGSTFLEISKKDTLSIEIPIPPTLKEQQTIATVLSDTDSLLSSLKTLLAKKKAIKQGTMQELLTGKKRLKGFTGDWEVKRLGEIAEFYKGKLLSKSELAFDGKYKCIHYGELFRRYREVITTILSKTNLNENAFYSKDNDVLMPTSDVTPNGLATASCVKENGILLGGDILVIRIPKTILNGIFLSYLISISKDKIMKLVTGSTVYHLYGSDMSKFKLSFPKNIKEQQAIAQILTDMDTEIETLESQLQKTENLKQGLMQELLTGKIRLVQPAIENKLGLVAEPRASYGG